MTAKLSRAELRLRAQFRASARRWRNKVRRERALARAARLGDAAAVRRLHRNELLRAVDWVWPSLRRRLLRGDAVEMLVSGFAGRRGRRSPDYVPVYVLRCGKLRKARNRSPAPKWPAR